MRAVDIISKKRNGKELSFEEIEFLVDGYVANRIPEYQMSAFLMSVYFQGMTDEETAGLTRIMMNSGDVFDLSPIPGIKVDKHSTGGVGDKVSLVLAPLVASAGVPVPMVSGRGLGHTGGTLDKLESIPGFVTRMDQQQFVKQVRETGVAIIGQTDNFVPADKKLYALRDVTATVESIPLICASIVSKKAASGTDAFVLDVKTGSGAFMKTMELARDLAKTLTGVLEKLGKKSIALITDMNQPLGKAVGNSLEVIECIETLKGEGPEDLREICLQIGAWMLCLGGKASDKEEGKAILKQKLHDGDALDKFREMITAQKGDYRIIDDTSLLEVSDKTYDLTSSESGYLSGFETRQIGLGSMLLGAGRATAEDTIDPGVGIICHKVIGDRISKGDVIYTVYYRDDKSLEAALNILQKTFTISDEPGHSPQLIKDTIC